MMTYAAPPDGITPSRSGSPASTSGLDDHAADDLVVEGLLLAVPQRPKSVDEGEQAARHRADELHDHVTARAGTEKPWAVTARIKLSEIIWPGR